MKTALTRDHDRLGAVAILIGAAVGVIYTTTLYPEVAWFPRFVLGMMVVLSILMLYKTFTKKGREKKFSPFFVHTPRFFLITGFFLAYIYGAHHVGYYTVTLIFIPCTAWALGYRKKMTIMATTLLYLLGVFVVFKLLFNLPFPPEFFQR